MRRLSGLFGPNVWIYLLYIVRLALREYYPIYWKIVYSFESLFDTNFYAADKRCKYIIRH